MVGDGLIQVVPISSHQDTVGPICRSVADAATVLSIIAGKDPLDNATFEQPSPVPDFLKALNPDALRGARLGIPRLFQGRDENIIAAFNASLEILKSLGAEIVDPADFPDAVELLASNNETIVLNVDFKVSNSYARVYCGSYYSG